MSSEKEAVKYKLNDQVKHGKAPFYLKKGDIKQLAMVKQYESIKDKDLDKVLLKRRKRNAKKEKKIQ